MEKRISFFEFQSVKNVAKAIDPLLREQQKIQAQIQKLQEDYHKKQTEIDAYEAGIVSIIGFHVSELVKKVVEPGVDKNGKETKTTKYLPTDIVSYDDATKQYVISVHYANEVGNEQTQEVTQTAVPNETVSANTSTSIFS